MELSVERGYALWAGSYDGEKNPLIAVEEPYAGQLLRGCTYSRVLDAGAGTGRYALRLAREGAQVAAVDVSPEMLGVAQKAASEEGLVLDVHLVSLEDGLPFCAGSFDLVVCALTMTHVRDMAGVAKEFHRVLVNGGHVLVTDFHPDSLAQGWRTEFSEGEVRHQLPNMPYSREDYLGSFRDAGFMLSKVIDVSLGEVPGGYLPETVVQRYGHVNLCLILLGHKP